MTVLGATFKENVPDVRNSGTARIVGEFRRYGMDVQVHDPLADHGSAHAELGVGLTRRGNLRPARAVVLAVAHDEWRREDAWTLVGSLPRERGRGGRRRAASARPRTGAARGPPLAPLIRAGSGQGRTSCSISSSHRSAYQKRAKHPAAVIAIASTHGRGASAIPPPAAGPRFTNARTGIGRR